LSGTCSNKMEPPSNLPPNLCDFALGALIGVLSFLVRVWTSVEKHSLAYIIRRTAIAGLASFLVGMAVGSYFSNIGISYAASGMAGYASPELVEWFLKRIKRGP